MTICKECAICVCPIHGKREDLDRNIKKLEADLTALTNKALLTVYDTVHPMPKVEISRLLTEINKILKQALTREGGEQK